MSQTHVQDLTGTLPTGTETLLSDKYPFDLNVLVTSTYTSETLEDAAHNLITNPHTVGIALDPQHHHVFVRFGTETLVKPGDYDSIAKAGNAHFRAGEWNAGLQAIATRAQASASSHIALAQANEPVVVEHGLSWGTWGLILFGFAALAACVAYLVRGHRKDRAGFERALQENKEETSELLSRNVRNADEDDFTRRLNADLQRPPSKQPAPVRPTRVAPGPYAAPSMYSPSPRPSYTQPTFQQPASTPVTVINAGGNNDGFVEGMLLGELMNQPSRTEVVHERDVVYAPVTAPSAPEPDAGGSSSLFDSGSSSFDSSSSDSGGSSSSFDFGGGSDFGGGGGFDGGGGGGDW